MRIVILKEMDGGWVVGKGWSGRRKVGREGRRSLGRIKRLLGYDRLGKSRMLGGLRNLLPMLPDISVKADRPRVER